VFCVYFSVWNDDRFGSNSGCKKQGQCHTLVADISGVPNLFGVCVYSFMCHHSLPSLITPISITLRNNLKALGYRENRQYPFWLDRILFPLLALIPPMCIAMATNQVEVLVGITGFYAGTGIQYVIPALLVFYARKQLDSIPVSNAHASPFRSFIWVIFVCVWAAVCIIFVTVNHIISGK